MDKSKQINLILFISAVAFTLFSMFPSFFELATREKLPPHRYFTLEHNYLFDYNFYLSRIRQGMEGEWLVTEKYFNRKHQESLFQIPCSVSIEAPPLQPLFLNPRLYPL